MLELIGKLTLVSGAWLVLCYCAACACRPYLRWLDQQALDDQDGFTPSMDRWGYVGEKRGGK